MPTIEPTLSAMPICACVHLWLVRKTAMNGPNPVCKLATKKFSQSRLRVTAAAVAGPSSGRRNMKAGSQSGLSEASAITGLPGS
jgi:hypothetical protein